VGLACVSHMMAGVCGGGWVPLCHGAQSVMPGPSPSCVHCSDWPDDSYDSPLLYEDPGLPIASEPPGPASSIGAGSEGWAMQSVRHGLHGRCSCVARVLSSVTSRQA